MAEILLSQGKAITLVDDSDFELLSQRNWCVNNYGYAYRTGRRLDGILWRKNILLHRQLLGLTNSSGEVEVDHLNHNKLDNRRSNLRICTHAQNAFNRRLGTASSSGFKGVSFRKGSYFENKPWRATITVNYKQVSLGHFKTKEEAALAYNEAAKHYFGGFAMVNTVKEDHD